MAEKNEKNDAKTGENVSCDIETSPGSLQSNCQRPDKYVN